MPEHPLVQGLRGFIMNSRPLCRWRAWPEMCAHAAMRLQGSATRFKPWQMPYIVVGPDSVATSPCGAACVFAVRVSTGAQRHVVVVAELAQWDPQPVAGAGRCWPRCGHQLRRVLVVEESGVATRASFIWDIRSPLSLTGWCDGRWSGLGRRSQNGPECSDARSSEDYGFPGRRRSGMGPTLDA